ncbi:PHO80 [Candida jiufengensis]|uniref:PHO80 n=1 Tax=Candida jiufengensis TaxID=497108 RepID=UPI0022241563|nr:PHO80 [Candida jiufengensis]KAI5950279.1 PHO80 [Candida jiufengensis]
MATNEVNIYTDIFNQNIIKNDYNKKKNEKDLLFISQYIKSNQLHTTLSDHQLYFQQINKERKLKSLEIYEKYLNNDNKEDKLKKQHLYKDYHHDNNNNNNNHNNNNDLLKHKLNHKLISPKIQHLKEESRNLLNEHKLSTKDTKDSQLLKKPYITNENNNNIQINKQLSTKKFEEDLSTKSKIKIKIQKLPINYMDCPIDYLILLISRMLLSLISLNDKSVPTSISNPPIVNSSSTNTNGTTTATTTTTSPSTTPTTTNNLLTRYHSRTPPAISIFTYLTRLTKFNNFNPANLLTTIYYIDLLSHQYQPFFTLNSWTVHRFLLVATMISQKCIEDFFYTNSHYAKVGGVALSELNCLELDFLNRVDWRLIPSKQTIINSKTNLLKNDIKLAQDVLNLYYFQLIELMGKNLIHDEKNYMEINNNNDNNTSSKFFLHFIKESPTQKDQEKLIITDEEIEDEGPNDIEEEEDDDDDDEEFYDSEDDEEMEEYDFEDDDEEEQEQVPQEKTKIEVPKTYQPNYNNKRRNSNKLDLLYDKNGYIINGSSSPHLKRRYSSE